MSATSPSSRWPSSGKAPAIGTQLNGLCVGWRAWTLALALTPATHPPGTGPYDGQPPAADSGLGTGQAEASSSAQPPAARTFGEEYPHFPNGHRRLGLSPQALVECHSWIAEARQCHDRLGFTSGDLLVYCFSPGQGAPAAAAAPPGSGSGIGPGAGPTPVPGIGPGGVPLAPLRLWRRAAILVAAMRMSGAQGISQAAF